jgi:hypothetical protein
MFFAAFTSASKIDPQLVQTKRERLIRLAAPTALRSITRGASMSPASAHVRSPIAVDCLLFFDGGWAVGSITHTNTAPCGAVDTFSNARSGFTAGSGIAYSSTNNIVGKIEFRYYDLGTYHRDAPLNRAIPYNVANTYSTEMLGLDFKFGGGPGAKYRACDRLRSLKRQAQSVSSQGSVTAVPAPA